MDTVRVNFAGFWNSFDKENNMFTRILRKHFHVEISDKPDFLICSNRGKPFEYMKHECVRIMFMGENLSPDWTVLDYCIGFDHMEFGDRYLRFPFAFYNDNGKPWCPEKLKKERAMDILQSKKYFCNFIYHHPSAHEMREKLFHALEKYKSVYSPGDYLNNVNNSRGGLHGRKKEKFLSFPSLP